MPRGRDEDDENVLLPEGRVPTPLSQAEIGLGDLGHVWNNFGASWDLGTRGNANFISQRKFLTSAMLLLEVASSSYVTFYSKTFVKSVLSVYEYHFYTLSLRHRNTPI